MENTIEIKIECKGAAAGTLGWFNSIMQHSEFVVKNSNTGTPAIFLKTTEENGKETYRFLCKKWDGRSDPFGYRLTGDNYLCELPESDIGYNGLFDVPLTPACREAVKDMINKAKEIFVEWWENQ